MWRLCNQLRPRARVMDQFESRHPAPARRLQARDVLIDVTQLDAVCGSE